MTLQQILALDDAESLRHFLLEVLEGRVFIANPRCFASTPFEASLSIFLR